MARILSAVAWKTKSLRLICYRNLLDSDGSETLTELVITGQGGGPAHVRRGETISVPPGGLDLGAAGPSDEGLTLMELANSGRLTWRPPEDASGRPSVCR